MTPDSVSESSSWVRVTLLGLCGRDYHPPLVGEGPVLRWGVLYFLKVAVGRKHNKESDRLVVVPFSFS